MENFSGYNQIQIKPEDQHKTTFICPWGTFSYQNMPFGIKKTGATFQRAMTLLSTQMALLRLSADIPYVGTKKDI